MTDSGKCALSSVVVCPDGGRAHKRSKKRSHRERVSPQEFSELRKNVTDMRKEFGEMTKATPGFFFYVSRRACV